MTFEDRNWRRPHKTAQQRPKDRLKGSQIAPVSPIEHFLCPLCEHQMLIHTDGCQRIGCGCEYQEATE